MNTIIVAAPTDATALLTQLYWHHASQAKGADQCTPEYHRDITAKLAVLLGLPMPKTVAPRRR